MDRHKLIVLLLLAVIGALCLWLWQSFNGYWRDFGLNGLTEVLGIVITVFLIDWLIAQREVLRIYPARRAAHDDVRLLVELVSGLWHTAYAHSVPEPIPRTLAALLSPEHVGKVCRWLDMDSIAPVTPRQTWRSRWPQQCTDHVGLARDVLQRDQLWLDPLALSEVRNFVNVMGNPSDHLRAMEMSDAELGLPRARHLGQYVRAPSQACAAILALAQWCDEEAARLEQINDGTLLRVHRELEGGGSPSSVLPCKLSEEDFAEYARNYAQRLRKQTVSAVHPTE